MREKKAKTWNMGLKHFEEFVKRNFNDDDTDQEINIPFPGLADDESCGLDCGFLTMNTEQVKDILEPVVKEVIELVQGQVDTIQAKAGKVSGIVLVGGFGQSNYMYKCMKSHFNRAPPPPYTERPTHKSGDDAEVQNYIEVMHP